MYRKHCFLSLALSFVLTAGAGAITLPVVQDTASSTRGSLTVAGGAATTLPINVKQSALIRFNVGGLQGVVPPDAVDSARLRIYFSSVIKPGDIELHRVTGDWSESQAGAFPTLDSPILTIPAASVVKKQFILVDVSATVRDWLTTGGDLGFALTTNTTAAKILLGSKEGSATGYPAELELDVAPSSVDGTTLRDGSVSEVALADGISAAKLGNGAVSNTEYSYLDGLVGNIQSQFAFKAEQFHTHAATQIVSGTLDDARLSSNVARVNNPNVFAVTQIIQSSGQLVLGLTSNNTGGTWLNLQNTSDPLARTYNLISTSSGNGEGAGKLLFRDEANGAVRLAIDSDGDVGVGTTSPGGKLEVAVGNSKNLRIRFDGVSAGIEAVSSQANDIYGGYIRLRNSIEVWPSSDGTKAGSLDVRNAAGNSTISLSGDTGKLAAANLPAAKFVKTVRDPHTLADDLMLNASQAADLDTISVNVPSDGFLIFRATANILLVSKAGTVGESFFALSETTSGSAVKLTEMHVTVSRETSLNLDTFQASNATLSWTVPASAGVRTFKTSVSTAVNSNAFIDSTTLLVEYVPNSL